MQLEALCLLERSSSGPSLEIDTAPRVICLERKDSESSTLVIVLDLPTNLRFLNVGR